jgi:hypothetical protein
MSFDMIYKKCRQCGIFFPSLLGNPNSYCNEHQAKWIHQIKHHFAKERFIPADFFNVYRYLNEQFYRACRVCGDPLIKKIYNKRTKIETIIPYQRMQFCKKESCTFDVFQRQYYWDHTKYDYYSELYKKQNQHDGFILCEKCGQQCKWRDNTDYDSPLPIIELHHKFPCANVDEHNWQLIWDKSNLIALCPTCHDKMGVGLIHHKKEVKTDIDKSFFPFQSQLSFEFSHKKP